MTRHKSFKQQLTVMKSVVQVKCAQLSIEFINTFHSVVAQEGNVCSCSFSSNIIHSLFQLIHLKT